MRPTFDSHFLEECIKIDLLGLLLNGLLALL